MGCLGRGRTPAHWGCWGLRRADMGNHTPSVTSNDGSERPQLGAEAAAGEGEKQAEPTRHVYKEHSFCSKCTQHSP